MAKSVARITITCSAADMETLIDDHKGELGRRVFWFLEEKLFGPIQVHLEMTDHERRSERIWSRE